MTKAVLLPALVGKGKCLFGKSKTFMVFQMNMKYCFHTGKLIGRFEVSLPNIICPSAWRYGQPI